MQPICTPILGWADVNFEGCFDFSATGTFNIHLEMNTHTSLIPDGNSCEVYRMERRVDSRRLRSKYKEHCHGGPRAQGTFQSNNNAT